MLVNGGRLLAGISEDRQVEPQFGVRLTGEQEKAGGLDPSTEIEDMEFSHALCSWAGHNSQRQFGPALTASEGVALHPPF